MNRNTPGDSAELLAAAKAYHEYGFNLLPIRAGTKRPAMGAWACWQSQRQTSADLLEMPWDSNSVSGIGAICGEVSYSLVALDIDRAKNVEVLPSLLSKLGLPDTYPWAVQTPGDGYHLWIRCPEIGEHMDGAGKLVGDLPGCDHVELRFDGHQTLLPPSEHPNGGSYRFVNQDYIPEEEPATVSSDRLLSTAVWRHSNANGEIHEQALPTETSRITNGRLEARVLEKAQAVRTALIGCRNDTLNAAAFVLGRLEVSGLDEHQAEAALVAAAIEAGLGESEALSTFHNGWAAGSAQAALPEVMLTPGDHSDLAAPDLGSLLSEVEAYIRRFVLLPSEDHFVAAALWIAHTHVYQQSDVSPYLVITSPERGSGKSRMLEVLDLLVANPWRTASPSEAVVFRKINQDHPTLLLDECDTVFGAKTASDHEGLRALLNAGHRRGTRVPRCSLHGERIVSFDTYSPKALAGIGKMPDTIRDRGITIRMAKKARGEKIERFRLRDVQGSAALIRDQLSIWAVQVNFLDARPELPEELDDRAQDNWEILLAIADEAAGDWPRRARRAARVLSTGRLEDTDSLGVRLLSDIRSLFEVEERDRMRTKELISELAKLEEAPWGAYRGGHEIMPYQLARLLEPYDIHPSQQRFGEEKVSVKGYLRRDFESAWNRYLEPLRNDARADGSETSETSLQIQEN